MAHIPRTDYLTAVDQQAEERINATHVGMAHFAGTGPRGAQCGGCAHWGRDERNAAAQCAKYWQLIQKSPPAKGYRIPRRTAACRHFEARSK